MARGLPSYIRAAQVGFDMGQDIRENRREEEAEALAAERARAINEGLSNILYEEYVQAPSAAPATPPPDAGAGVGAVGMPTPGPTPPPQPPLPAPSAMAAPSAPAAPRAPSPGGSATSQALAVPGGAALPSATPPRPDPVAAASAGAPVAMAPPKPNYYQRMLDQRKRWLDMGIPIADIESATALATQQLMRKADAHMQPALLAMQRAENEPDEDRKKGLLAIAAGYVEDAYEYLPNGDSLRIDITDTEQLRITQLGQDGRPVGRGGMLVDAQTLNDLYERIRDPESAMSVVASALHARETDQKWRKGETDIDKAEAEIADTKSKTQRRDTLTPYERDVMRADAAWKSSGARKNEAEAAALTGLDGDTSVLGRLHASGQSGPKTRRPSVQDTKNAYDAILKRMRAGEPAVDGVDRSEGTFIVNGFTFRDDNFLRKLDQQYENAVDADGDPVPLSREYWTKKPRSGQ